MHLAVPLFLALVTATTPPTFDDASAKRVMEVAAQKYAESMSRLSPTEYPELIAADGHWTVVSNTNKPGWTQGFYPGVLWYLYELSGDEPWKTAAETWTANLEEQKTNRTTHDLGFKMFDSFGAQWRLTNDAHARDVLLESAASLASRYHQVPGAISCCDWNRDWHLPIVSDTMMNLELLFWAAENGGDPAWRQMAINHALLNATEIVRPDGSSFHYIDYDPATGNLLSKGTYQGDSDNSTWSRGHVWEIYGFTVAYRYTQDPRMLEAAVKTTDWYLSQLPADMVPNWDFDAASKHPDTSAAAAAASALLELSTYVDAENGRRYRDAALKTLGSLSSAPYFNASGTGDSVLLGGTADLPHGKGVDTGLIYGDYYLLEAIQRFRTGEQPAPGIPTVGGGTPTTPTTGANSSAPQGGCVSTGLGDLAGLSALLLFALRRWKRTSR